VEEQALQTLLAQLEGQVISPTKSLSILRLHPQLNSALMNSSADLALVTQLSRFNHRLVEADDLEQADLVARIWNVDVVVLDGKLLEEPKTYLRSLRQCSGLAALPLVILDAKTMAVANQMGDPSVFPCLIPENEQSFSKLLQVIQIAVG
jgi:hypothetical protein